MNRREKRFMDAFSGQGNPDEKMIQTRDSDPMAPASAVLETHDLVWEYKSVVLQDTADINSYGADGWELVAKTPRPGDQAVFQFKRRRRL